MTPASPQELAELDRWNARAADDLPLGTVTARFDEQVARRPAAPAVRCTERPLSYAELDAAARSLAHLLIAHGARPGDCIAVCLPRGPDVAIALLAILRAGGFYLPLEPHHPPARLAFVLGDAAVRLCVTSAAHRAALPAGLTCLALDALPLRIAEPDVALPDVADPEAPAYVCYTSGSTGEPKGVLVPHRAIDRLVKNVDYARLDDRAVILQASPLAFDASTFELWGSLLNGGSVAFFPDPLPTAASLGRAIRSHGVTTMWLTAALFNAVIDDDPGQLEPLEQLLIGGEALSPTHVRRAQQRLPRLLLINGYGPTETTTFATCHPIPRDLPADASGVPIGRPIRRTRCYVVDAEGRRVGRGVEGELWIGGDGVALGYLQRPELTAARFVPDPFGGAGRVYRTGDLVRLGADYVLEFRGRADQQLKIRGFRIEPGEIEHALARLPGVRSCAVIARRDGAEPRLVGYVVPEPGAAADAPGWRRALAAALPEFMLPARLVVVPELPRTANGKLDARALPPPPPNRPPLAVDFRAPASPIEARLATLWGEALGVEPLGVDDNFFDLGASSLLVIRCAAAMRQQLGLDVAVTAIFAHPTVRGLAAVATGAGPGDALGARLAAFAARPRAADTPIAIIGMAGRFPGAEDIEALWANLVAGVESITHWRPDELDPAVPRALAAAPDYVPARGVVADCDCFDAAFFGIPPAEAVLTDPQQRLLLEECWHALEHAGYAPGDGAPTVGVFAGTYNASYFDQLVRRRPDLVAGFGAFQTMLANEKDYVATRIAHRLDLSGPAVSVHTACSTSLVAVVQAVQALQLGQCDLALAGGASIIVPVRSGHLYKEGEMLSPDGRTRPFDQTAKGTVFSDGVAVVVLKRLDDAIAAGDTIHAVIRGAAVNNDGGGKASFTAPNVAGQAAVIAMAQRLAGVTPAAIGYVEAHGTATPLGDPIEFEALTRAFRLGSDAVGTCLLGSLKSNVGHLVVAAGAAGLIKAALALARETIPASLWFTAPNPAIDLESSPFRIAATTTPWPRGPQPRFAGVSSFGVGGTNAHVVIAEPPPPPPPQPNGRRLQLLLVTARSEAALAATSARLAAHLERHPDQPLDDVAFTLHAGRRRFAWTHAVVAADHAAAAALLRDPRPPAAGSRCRPATVPGTAFLFPGQGAQHPGMAASLYRDRPDFRADVDHCAAVLQPELGEDLRAVMFRGDQAALRATSRAQPALFTVAYALARLWQRLGVAPRAMVGHSVGEFVCAVLAGVIDLDDGLRLVARRGALMQSAPPGAMLAVRAAAAAIAARLPPAVAVAADNGPEACVVAGPETAVGAVRQQLEADGIACQPLQTSHAFHTPAMASVAARFGDAVAAVPLHPPAVPFVSTATGAWITAAEATDPGYWARHLLRPVQFAAAVRTLLEAPDLALLEVGPRATLTALARQQCRDPGRAMIASQGNRDDDGWPCLLAAAGQLAQLGIALDPAVLHGPGRRRRVPLPGYAFDRRRHWIDVPAPAAELPLPAADVPADLAEVLALQASVMRQQLDLLLAARAAPPIQAVPGNDRD